MQIAEEESPVFFLDPQDSDVLSIQPKDPDVARNKTPIKALPLPLRDPGAKGSDDVFTRGLLHQGEDEIRVFRAAWPGRKRGWRIGLPAWSHQSALRAV